MGGARSESGEPKPSPFVEFANWDQCERLVPQALACALLINAYGFESQEAARLLNQAGYYLRHRARFSEADRFTGGRSRSERKPSVPTT